MIRVIKDRAVPKFEKATKGSAAYDLYYIGEPIAIYPGKTELLSTGIKLDLSGVPGMYALVLPRSGVSLKTNLRVANAPGLIDNDYQGEVKVIIHNSSYNKVETVNTGDRIAQLLFCSQIPVTEEAFKIEFVDGFKSTTERGEGGFGSTGK